MNHLLRLLVAISMAFVLAACPQREIRPTSQSPQASVSQTVVPRVLHRPPRVALALGGGAARGFAHIGVIKALVTSGITPDIVVGTSAGSVVGSLYASGYGPYDLQRLALRLDESSLTDWAIFDRGVLKGEALEKFINQSVHGKPIEGLKLKFAAVATELETGKPAIFTSGNVGMAVRASSSIPGVFSPMLIRGHEYVDGGVVSPIPVHAARQLGADIVIAVDISDRPSGKRNQGTLDVLMDTMSIMGTALGTYELHDADVVIRPKIKGLPIANFKQRDEAIMRGEQAGYAAVSQIREKIAEFEKK